MEGVTAETCRKVSFLASFEGITAERQGIGAPTRVKYCFLLDSRSWRPLTYIEASGALSSAATYIVMRLIVRKTPYFKKNYVARLR